jgi:cell division protein FtsN
MNVVVGWIKNIFLVIILVVVIVASFYVSFTVGKKMLSPESGAPVRNFVVPETMPALPPRVTLEAPAVTIITKEARKPPVKKVPTVEASPVMRKIIKKVITRPVTRVPAAKSTRSARKAKEFYTIQLGAFSHIKNAENFQEEVVKKGFAEAEVYVGNLNRVVYGKYYSLEEAKTYLVEFRKAGFEAFIKKDD